jgi:hypothetical protein
MAKVKQQKPESKSTRDSMKYYAVILDGYTDNQEYSILIAADCFNIEEQGSLAMFYAGGGGYESEEGEVGRLVAALRGWKRVMEISKERFKEIFDASEKKDQESSKKLNSVFVEPGRM